jgi:pyrroloquinoline quinone biosynthesis protein D
VTSQELTRPQLAKGVRLQWDPVREQHVLLFPEGALALNGTAAAVLELCDGDRTVDDIVERLSAEYEDADVGPDVREVLGRIAERGLVIDART